MGTVRRVAFSMSPTPSLVDTTRGAVAVFRCHADSRRPETITFSCSTSSRLNVSRLDENTWTSVGRILSKKTLRKRRK